MLWRYVFLRDWNKISIKHHWFYKNTWIHENLLQIDHHLFSARFQRKVPCTLDFETRREFINRKDEAGRKEAAISKVFERELTPISIPNFPNFLMTLMYSIFLGIFGCDRCYLGNRLLGMFKLLSIGGLGFWWMIDTILLIYGVSRPEDGINWDPYFWFEWVFNWVSSNKTQITTCNSNNPFLTNTKPNRFTHKQICTNEFCIEKYLQ